jgi:hypothetical protein
MSIRFSLVDKDRVEDFNSRERFTGSSTSLENNKAL